MVAVKLNFVGYTSQCRQSHVAQTLSSIYAIVTSDCAITVETVETGWLCETSLAIIASSYVAESTKFIIAGIRFSIFMTLKQ